MALETLARDEAFRLRLARAARHRADGFPTWEQTAGRFFTPRSARPPSAAAERRAGREEAEVAGGVDRSPGWMVPASPQTTAVLLRSRLVLGGRKAIVGARLLT